MRRFSAARPWAALLLPVLLVPVSLVLAACGGAAERAPLNVVVILLDTLRADRVGAYGYGRGTTPALDDLARRGVVFDDARAQSPCTFPSVNSLLTSRPVFDFLEQPAGDLGIPPHVPSLATLLAERGYTTLAASASPVVRATPSDVNRVGGFGAGFDRFDEACLWREGACVTDAGFRLLDAAEPPFLLYLHYMDPHDPYTPPPELARRFAGEPTPRQRERDWLVGGDPNPIASMLYADGPEVEVTPADLAYLEGLYDAEVAYADRQVRVVLRALEKRRLRNDTLVVVVSDHGESFLEDGDVKHCRSLHDREVKTPFIFALPGLQRPRRVTAPVANTDLLPTILDYVDRWGGTGEGTVDRAEAGRDLGFAGRSLRPWAEGEMTNGEADGDGHTVSESPSTAPAFSPEPVFSAITIWRSAADDRFKLIHNLETGTWQLYDLRTDPEETTDVLDHAGRDDYRRDFHRLRTALVEWMQATGGDDAATTREAGERLRALGYLQ